MSPLARRRTQPHVTVSPDERQRIRDEIMDEVRRAADRSTSFEDFRDAIGPAVADDPVTIEDVRKMDAATVNSRWSEVSALLENGEQAAEEPTPPAADGPASTGIETNLSNDGSQSEFAQLTRAAVEKMSPSEQAANRVQIDAWLERTGGRA